MTNYHCPTCGQVAEKPPWLLAREAGYDPDKHCTMLANRLGKLINCASDGFCEICNIRKKFTKIVKDKFGREREVFCNE